MPHMDGLEATRKIRRQHRGRPPYVVAFTANAFRSEIEKCAAAGMDDYLIKPVRLQALAKMLEKAWRVRHGEARPQPEPGSVAAQPDEVG